MISLNVIILGRFAPLGLSPREAHKTHVQGSPQSRASLNTLVKIILILGDNGQTDRPRDCCRATD